MNKLIALPAAVAMLLALGACGSDAGTDSASSATTSAAASEGTGPMGGGGSEQFQEIQACLSAAGLDDALPSGGPGGPGDGEAPSGVPTDMPSGAPTDMPSGGPGGGMGLTSDPEVQAALQACGIELPSGGPGADAGASASAG